MAITSYPFDGQVATEAQYTKLFSEFQDSGITNSVWSTSLRVVANGSNRDISILPGRAFIRGHIYESTETQVITPPMALNSWRNDLYVLRLDPSLNQITLVRIVGSPNAGRPALTQTETGIFELPLADVWMGSNYNYADQSHITDLRSWAGHRTGVWYNATRPPSPRVGKLGRNLSTNKWEFWNGSEWQEFGTASWGNLSGKPETYPPSSHTHGWDGITDKPTAFPPAAHTHAELQTQIDALAARIAALETGAGSVAARVETLETDAVALEARVEALETPEPEGGA
ncbi:hypothetical protein [Actinocorallia libanotica]|uniref:Uncharacterized protein n=1 Tax=Actinocorallia libanotica TaxID=46162 RepID=A0ABP4CEH1_9ACTN